MINLITDFVGPDEEKIAKLLKDAMIFSFLDIRVKAGLPNKEVYHYNTFSSMDNIDYQNSDIRGEFFKCFKDIIVKVRLSSLKEGMRLTMMEDDSAVQTYTLEYEKKNASQKQTITGRMVAPSPSHQDPIQA